MCLHSQLLGGPMKLSVYLSYSVCMNASISATIVAGKSKSGMGIDLYHMQHKQSFNLECHAQNDSLTLKIDY